MTPNLPYTHDRFYMRIGVGAAYTLDRFERSRASEAETFKELGRGFGVATELAFGGTPTAGLVVGGGIYGGHAFSLKAYEGQRELASWESVNTVLVGPFLDYYPEPASGVHIQGALGPALIEFDDGQRADAFGIMVGLGHEWFFAPQWSVGVLGRILLAAGDAEDEDGSQWDHAVLVPSVLLTTTLH